METTVMDTTAMGIIIILHIIFSFTLLPLHMKSKGWCVENRTVAVIIALSITPVSLVLSPFAAFLGMFPLWLANKLIGWPK
ncbi:hypothetical protein JN06_02322 [Bacteroides zoogleoformans]|nr:hypothetical protein [Bacteroides zoogleoformans]TWJ11230.1 hypothetical protein JN06_02322 [Bacteroides zoogleoformans]